MSSDRAGRVGSRSTRPTRRYASRTRPQASSSAVRTRSRQHKNKDAALLILKAKLYELEEQKRKEEIDALRGQTKEITFGSQIRNYVLYPYQMVKDVRTELETGNVDAVLDGSIDEFVVGYHRWRVGQEQATGAEAGA